MISRQAQLKYLNRRLDEMAGIEDLLFQKNFPEASTLFHKVKGSASTFHFVSLGDLATRLESACETNTEQAPELFRRYRNTVDQLKNEVARLQSYSAN